MARRRLLDFTTVTGSHVFYGLQRFDGSQAVLGFHCGAGSHLSIGFIIISRLARYLASLDRPNLPAR